MRLVDLLDEAVTRAKAEFEARAESGEGSEEVVQARTSLVGEELDRAAAVVGYSAVKYADLKSNRTKDYEFSYDRMLSVNGNTAVYLIYAHARVCSIVDKVWGALPLGLATLHSAPSAHPARTAVGCRPRGAQMLGHAARPRPPCRGRRGPVRCPLPGKRRGRAPGAASKFAL